jgi:hypothetical protein
VGVPKSLIDHLGSRAWVLDHLDDLESDFSVFHRVDDLYELDAERFWAMAERIMHYGGATVAAVRRVQADQPRVRYVEDEHGAPAALTPDQLAALGGMGEMG